MNLQERVLKKVARKFGYQVHKISDSPKKANNKSSSKRLSDLTDEEKKILESVTPFTMTSAERIISLIRSTDYIVKNKILGAIVECGVWRGGSIMATLQSLLANGENNREIYLYDTFEGMSPPTEKDFKFDGSSAQSLLNTDEKKELVKNNWCYASLEDVKENVLSTGYPESKIHFVEGKVEETIPLNIPDSNIALLRLDTDWYESTKHELIHLFPLLDSKGVLIIDDYGHWQGCKKAVDEYFNDLDDQYFFFRIDYTGRLIIKAG